MSSDPVGVGIDPHMFPMLRRTATQVTLRWRRRPFCAASAPAARTTVARAPAAQLLHKSGPMNVPGQARLPRPPEGASRAPGGGALADRLKAIAAETACPEEALEPALHAVLEAVGVKTGALCVFDPRHELLWLAAESGLSDAGCKALRNVRRGSALTWDMPLHSLLNRRAYLIDDAARNRYVPPLVDAAASVRTIACLPLFADNTPVGSLVLIALAPQALREQDLRNVHAPLRELVAMIESVRKRASAAAAGSPASSSSAATATATPSTPPTARTTPATAPAAPRTVAVEDTARIQALTLAVARAERERDRLAAALESATQERATVARQQEALQARLVEATTEVEWTRVRLADAESGAAKAHERACEAERERERAGVALDAGNARERALQAEVEGLQAEIERLKGAVAAAEETRARAEGDEVRAAAVAEAAAAQQALATMEAVVGALEEEATRAHAEIARLEEMDTRDALERERELTDARTQEHDAQARLTELDAELARLRAESVTLAARADETIRIHEETTRREWDAVRQRLEEELAAARAQDEERRTQMAALDAEVARLRAECGTLRDAAAASVREQDEITRQELDRARAQLEHELEAARTREADATTRLAELESEVGVARDERDALVVNLETLTADRNRLREALAALEAERSSPDFRVATSSDAERSSPDFRVAASLDAEGSSPDFLIAALEEAELATATDTDEDPLAAVEEPGELTEIVELLALEDEPAPAAVDDPAPVPDDSAPEVVEAATPVGVAEGAPLLLVLDADAAWEDAGIDRYTIVHAAPDSALARLGGAVPTHVVANLAAPGVFGALSELRAAGITVPFWGCLADAAANRAIPLGRVEPALRPLDPDAVLAALGAAAGRGTKVVTVGTDVDALMSLRQIFTRQGLSVSMAWDAKQAADLLAMIRPTLVVVDLEQPPRVGYGIVARVTSADPVPTTVAISSSEKDPAAGFRTALADAAHNHRVVTIARVLSQMVNRAEQSGKPA